MPGYYDNKFKMYQYRQISMSRHDSISHAEPFKDY